MKIKLNDSFYHVLTVIFNHHQQDFEELKKVLNESIYLKSHELNEIMSWFEKRFFEGEGNERN